MVHSGHVTDTKKSTFSGLVRSLGLGGFDKLFYSSVIHLIPRQSFAVSILETNER